MMKTLSPIGEAIRHYKLNPSDGYQEWSKGARATDYRMHVPAMGFDETGHDEVRDVIFGWLTDIGAEQELVDIVEFGASVTCYLQIKDKEGVVLDIVEVCSRSTKRGEWLRSERSSYHWPQKKSAPLLEGALVSQKTTVCAWDTI